METQSNISVKTKPQSKLLNMLLFRDKLGMKS